MNKEHLLYISPEDDLPGICTRLEHAHSRRVVLVMPPRTTHLRSLVTWRMLHAYTRRQGIKVHIVSENAYIRSVARNARFTVAHSLDTVSTETAPHISPSVRRTSRQASPLNGYVRRSTRLAASIESEESLPPTLPIIDITETFLFDGDTENDNVIPLPRANPSIIRTQKAPQPLDLQQPRHTLPASQRLPWDDVYEEPYLQVHPIKRRSGVLAPPTKRRSQPLLHNDETIDLSPYLPVLCIGLFIMIRGIVHYIRSRA